MYFSSLALIQLHQLHLLRQQIPSVKHVLETLHKNPDNLKLGMDMLYCCQYTVAKHAIYSTADLMHRLLGLEAEHKPLPGYEPALNDVLAYLHKVCIILNVHC